MEKNVLQTDLTGKVAVVTGAGGVLCSYLAKVLARAGAKVALVNRSEGAINQYAAEIVEEGGIAKAYKGNVLSKEDMERIADQVLADFGPVDILLNGAGGNNARAQTDKEYYEPGDLEVEGLKTFFDLDDDGGNMCFDLNYNGTLIPTQAFAKHMVKNGGGNIINISSMNAFLPLTKIPAYSGAKAAVSNPASSLPSRTRSCCSTRTAPPPSVPKRSWQAPPWAVSARPRNWQAVCCSCWMTRQPVSSPVLSCPSTAASPHTPAYNASIT